MYEFPANRFVADFVGAANIFESEVVEATSDRIVLRCDGLDGTIESGPAETCAPGQRIWFTLRPEKLQLGASRRTGQPT